MRTLIVLLLVASSAFAGGGPETTLLVVNEASPLSRQIAHLYANRRGLAPSHVLYLDTVPHDGVITIKQFRELIWTPIEAHMKQRGLTDRIDLITYSADFPYAVDFRALLDGERPGRAVGGQAALTGVTYLIRQVEADAPFWDVQRGASFAQTNRYSRFDFGGGGARGRPRLTGEQRGIYVRASAEMRAGNLREAEKGYKAFLDVAPQVGQAWVAYAVCLVKLRKTADAIDALESARRNGFNNAGRVEAQDEFKVLRGNERFQRMLEGMRGAAGGLRTVRGFRASRAWSDAGEPVDEADSMHRYFLSTQLAYIGLGGNSYGEVANYLRRAVEADYTSPGGTVYICKNSNVRSTAREPFFGALTSSMRGRGRRVVLLEKTKIPQGKSDVIGAVVGTAGFNWGKSKSTMVPGAICEHLTSFGAHYGTTSQTKISEFLRHGAAGSSGTIQEPLALHVKFPNPMIHAFYADGCTLAEAFYQSVHAPYQLMVAGDGLCQPFAKRAEFTLAQSIGALKGTVTFTPEGAGFDYELWADGLPIASGASLEWDTTTALDGAHELAVVAVSKDALETRTRRSFVVEVDNLGAKLTAVAAKERYVLGDSIRLRVEGAKAYDVFCGSRKVDLASARLGPGRVRLDVRSKQAQAAPVWLDIVPPKPAPAASGEFEPALGLAATINGSEPWIVTTLGGRASGLRLSDQLAGRKDIKTLALRGALHVATASGKQTVHQLNVRGNGTVSVRVAGRQLCKDASLARQIYLPVSLAAGWHTMEIDYAPAAGRPDLELLVTGPQVGAPPRIGRALPTSPQPTMKTDKDGALVATWKRRPRKPITAITLLPVAGTKAKRLDGWKLEWRTSTRGKWKPLTVTHELVAPPSRRPPKPKKGEKPQKLPPQSLELIIPPTKPKQLRLLPPIRYRVLFRETRAGG